MDLTQKAASLEAGSKSKEFSSIIFIWVMLLDICINKMVRGLAAKGVGTTTLRPAKKGLRFTSDLFGF
jgi:hypothetical protein